MKCSSILNSKTLKSFISNHSILEKLEKFNLNVNTIISNIKNTNGKIAIISDFDYTLTKRFDLNNDLTTYYSSYCVFENAKSISDEYRKKNQEMFNKYHKYETDLSIDYEIRNEFVLKWYRDNLDLIVNEDINRNHFIDMVEQSHEKLIFRNGILELFEIVREYNIPFFIISGGLYEIIEDALKIIVPFYNSLKTDNLITIIANKFIFEETTEKLIGYQEPIVYTFNKGDIIKSYFEKYEEQIENIIVLGDHINDVDSVKNLDIKNLIKIGFLNSKYLINSPEDYFLYEAFSKHFDIGIMNDGTLNHVNHILIDILSMSDRTDRSEIVKEYEDI